MEMLKYLLLGSCFVIVFAQSLDYSGWPSAAGLRPKDTKFILDNLNYLARARGLSPPVSLLRAKITKRSQHNADVTTYKAVYSAADGSTCEGKVIATVKDCGNGMGMKCTSTQQSAHCYPAGFPGLIV